MPGFNFEDIDSQISRDFDSAQDAQALESLRVKYLGRRGILAELTSRIPDLPDEQRPLFGQEVNRIKRKVSELLEEKKKALGDMSAYPEAVKRQAREIDVTLPGITQELGHRHIITQVIEEICNVFVRLGFAIVEGPEIETEYNNFTALNIPLEHPSRDVFDTFYLSAGPRAEASKSKLLLRSHTSPVQIRAMKSRKPPLAIVVPGRVYRPDAVDASHSFMFHQIEGFMVDYDITFSDLKGILEFFAKSVFGGNIKMRFRPHFFPFTEPSAEVDISCIICKGKGCSVCGQKGWLEILGSGMIHPNVFRHVGYDTTKYTGFAFGMGVDRIAMLKYGIDDIRLFYENDLRFLRQF
ncbi:MAG: phenylalanine--tRNA ligase subunit alpha [Candidatus Omnitrophota bacterium]